MGLAYLKAFADVNHIGLTGNELAQLEYRLEHDELNLQIGLLDPLTIVHGRQDALLLMDTLTPAVTPIVDPARRAFAWIVAYSGVSRELTKSGFNVRVDECKLAASQLKEGARVLSDVPRALYEDRKMSLPEESNAGAENTFSRKWSVFTWEPALGKTRTWNALGS